MRKLNLSRNSKKFLEKLQYSDKKTYLLILDKINKLVDDPIYNASKKLVGYESLYRLRVDKYRVIYNFDRAEIRIMHISKREDVYDFLLK